MTDFATIGIRSDTTGLNRGRDDMRRFRQTGARTEQRVNRASQSMAASMRTLRRAIAPLAGAMAAAFSVRGLARTMQGLDDIAKQARSIDGTANALRATQLAMTEAGVSAAEAVSGMQRVNRELARAARGAGNGADALRRLGLTAAELQRMDVDDRFAAIADAVHEAGLSAGEASDLLRDLGARSREMALALIDGGDGIREAREELRRLGLELDDTDLRAVEDANDAMARMGLVATSLGQQIAITLAPALQSMAQAFSNIMGEGEAFRSLAESIGRILSGWVTIITQSVEGVNALAGAFDGAEFAAMGLVAALVALRAGLIRTGIGALIVGAGELTYQFSRLIRATGSWGEALELLGDIALGVLSGIVESAKSLPEALAVVWQQIKVSFSTMVADMLASWAGMLDQMGMSISDLGGAGSIFRQTGANILGVAQSIDNASHAMRDSAEVAQRSVDGLREKIGADLSGAFEEVRAAGFRLATIMKNTSTNTDEATDAADRLNEALSNIGDPGGGGGGSAGAATDGMDRFRDSIADTRSTMSEFENASRQAFVGFVSGADSARQAASRLLDSFARILANQAFTGLFGGLFGGGASLASGFSGGQVPGMYASGTSSAASGLAWVGERGPELVNFRGGEQVFDAQTSQRMAQGGGQPMHITVQVDGASGDDHIVSLVQQGVRAGLGEYDRALPDRVRQVNNDPRGRR